MKIILRYLSAIAFVGLAFSLPANVFAQQLSEEPAGGMDEASDVASTRSLPPTKITLPEQLDIAPVNEFYKSWDTLCVRRYADPISRVNDSIRLPLTFGGTEPFYFPHVGQLLSPFGYRGRRVHAGVDIKLNLYDTVGAAFDGVVRMARYYHGYGNCVVVRHYNGLETLYGHLAKIRVKVNQEVKAGDLIGLGGRTGRATCTHLHFETRFMGQAFNPKQLIDFDNHTLIQDTLVITSRTFGRSRDYIPSDNQLLASADSRSDFSDRHSRSAKDSKKLSEKNKKASKSQKSHTVKNGDTLSSIARKNGTTVKQLCKLNGIKPTKILKLGSKLRVK
jgi:murein DD-endopeptidase MepM/ murein hydrolase activator NlpD